MSDIERMTIAIPTPMADTVRAAVEAGEYSSTSEVFRDALRLWEARRELRARDLETLRSRWDPGGEGGAGGSLPGAPGGRGGRGAGDDAGYNMTELQRYCGMLLDPVLAPHARSPLLTPSDCADYFAGLAAGEPAARPGRSGASGRHAQPGQPGASSHGGIGGTGGRPGSGAGGGGGGGGGAGSFGGVGGQGGAGGATDD
jgi:antitoxin ParD1/3/4